MPSKRVKAYDRNPNERKHRTHRSKRGENRNFMYGKEIRLKLKRKLEELKLKDLEKDRCNRSTLC